MISYQPMTRGIRRTIAGLAVIVLAFAAIVILYTARTTQELQREVQSQCQFDADLGGVQISVIPPARKPAVLGVKIVSDSRVAWRIAGCTGHLAPPTASFLRWARFYHLPAG